MTTTVNNYVITQHRKNITRLTDRLKDKARQMLDTGFSLQEISEELYKEVKADARNFKVYVSYWPINDWNDKELLSIRDSSQDCTLVSIRLKL